jgi:hypothetical protein
MSTSSQWWRTLQPVSVQSTEKHWPTASDAEDPPGCCPEVVGAALGSEEPPGTGAGRRTLTHTATARPETAMTNPATARNVLIPGRSTRAVAAPPGGSSRGLVGVVTSGR